MLRRHVTDAAYLWVCARLIYVLFWGHFEPDMLWGSTRLARRPHSSLKALTPDQVYFNRLPETMAA